MFDWGNWVIQTVIAAFFISGFVVFSNQGLAALENKRKQLGFLTKFREPVVATTFIFAMAGFCELAQYWNPSNEAAYLNWALYILFMPLLRNVVRPLEYGIRCLGILVFWIVNNNVRNPLFYLSLVFIAVILGFIYRWRREINRSWLIRMEVVLWIALDFWLQQTQMTVISVAMSVVMFVLVNIFTMFYWSSERITELERHQLEQRVNRDELTRVGSFFAFKSDSLTKIGIARSEDMPLTLLMFDIDYFKAVNDTYGHMAGNHILAKTAMLIATELKQYPQLQPSFYRTGGEEFNIIFMADAADTLFAAKAIQKRIRQHRFHFENQTITVTLSMGVTALTRDDMSFEDVYERADQNLYLSKQGGRDRITVEGQSIA